MKAPRQIFSAFSLLLTLFIFLGGTPFLFSQIQPQKPDEIKEVPLKEQLGVIEGIITDKEETPLPGVTIEAASPSLKGKLFQSSDESGHFRLSDLPPGTYTITLSLPGFRTVRREGIRVRSGSTTKLRETMDLVATEEEVTVDSGSPMVIQEKTEEKWATKADVEKIAAQIHKMDGVIKEDVSGIEKSVTKLQGIVNRLAEEINILKDSIEDYQKKHKDLIKKLEEIEAKIK